MKRAPLFLFISLAFLCIVSCELVGDDTPAAVEDSTGIPEAWIEFDAGGKFTFTGPPDLEPQEITGIDSFVGYYQGERMAVEFDYGRFSPEVACSSAWEYIHCRVADDEVNGRAARVLTGAQKLPPSQQPLYGGPILYGAEVRIDNVAADSFGTLDLVLRADSPQASDTTWLKMIVYSVKLGEL